MGPRGSSDVTFVAGWRLEPNTHTPPTLPPPNRSARSKEKQHSFLTDRRKKKKKHSHQLSQKTVLALGMFMVERGIPPGSFPVSASSLPVRRLRCRSQLIQDQHGCGATTEPARRNHIHMLACCQRTSQRQHPPTPPSTN